MRASGKNMLGVFFMEDGFGRRVVCLMVVFLLVAGSFVTRLAWLQLIQGRELAAIAAKYHSRRVYYRWGHGGEGRGAILDRKLRPFTEAKLQPGLAVFAGVGEKDSDYTDYLQLLARHSGFSTEDIVLRSEQGLPLPLNVPLSADMELPHWIVPVAGDWDREGNFRRYSYGSLACHVLGIVQPPFSGEAPPGKLVGRLGIEKKFDQLLRSQRPGVLALVDAKDRLIEGLGYRSIIEPCQQPNIVLTLDIEIQQQVEKIFDDYIQAGRVPAWGALVVMDPNNGDILAMASRPVIDGSSNQYNRATRKSNNVDMQPLASMVKVVTTAAALEKNPQLLKARFTCAGTLKLGENVFECTQGSHGEQDLSSALANSCNLYFAQLAQEVGGKELLAMAEAMGLGARPSIDLPSGEVGAGNLPNPQDLATAAGLANNFAMGGNKLEVTPLQAAAMLSSVANGGWRVEPRLVLGVNQDLEKKIHHPKAKAVKIMSSATADMVAQLMRNAVVQRQTGYFDHNLYPAAADALAAKTGTSDPLPPLGYHIRWYGGFFPWRSPKYVVVYMAEAPNSGTTVERGRIVAEVVQGLADLTGE
jgi:cell division protein FtsI/penicillin-binding protein 2